MSKGERNRIGIRVRAAMASQAKIEGRFLGGRPPYGYRVVDAGPHPTPAKAADGKRLHRLADIGKGRILEAGRRPQLLQQSLHRVTQRRGGLCAAS